MSSPARHPWTRRRRWWQSRGLLVAVIVLDLVGGGGLAYALTRHPGTASHGRSALVSGTASLAQVPTSPPAASAAAATTTITSTGARAPARALDHRLSRNPPARLRRGVIPTPLNVAAALGVVRAEHDVGHRVGFAVVNSDGRTLASAHASEPNYGGSITKSMLLVAYLRQTGDAPVSADARAELTSMIEVSDNAAADWVYDHLNSPNSDVLAVAQEAGMTGFRIDTSDPVYVLGQSLVTAGDFARFFSMIENLMPAAQRAFGMGLLAGVQERVGFLAAGLPGVVYAKEGWKPEPSGLLGAPYIVNQAAQFTWRNATYGLAVTVGDVADQDDGQAVTESIASALMRPS